MRCIRLSRSISAAVLVDVSSLLATRWAVHLYEGNGFNFSDNE